MSGSVKMPPKPPTKTDSKMDGLNNNVMTFWNQLIDLQKSSIDSSREQWDQFTEQLMEMEDTFADSLPEELPLLPVFPFWPLSPKEMLEQWREFEERSKEHMMEQADSIAVYHIRSQEQARDMANSVYDKTSDITKESDDEDEYWPKPKATSAKKKGARVKTVRAKSAPKTSEARS
jgi:hypothetical protein